MYGTVVNIEVTEQGDLRGVRDAPLGKIPSSLR